MHYIKEMLSCQGWIRCSLQLCWLCIIIFLQNPTSLPPSEILLDNSLMSLMPCSCKLFLHLNRPTPLFAGKVATGTVIGSFLSEVVHLSFCFSDERVAACSGVSVHVLSSKVQGDAHCHSCA